MKKNSLTIRSVTFAAVAGLSLGIAAPGAIAVAQEGQNLAISQAASDSPLVNKNAKGSLTIHKFGNPNSEKNPTGTGDQQVDGGKTLAGIGFDVYRIKDIDLTTNEGLAKAAGKKATDYVNGFTPNSDALEKVDTYTTGPDGTVVLKDLQLGAYLVIETDSVADDGVEYTPGNPFIAFVPMTEGNSGDGQGTTWNYDVHAYPKNYETTKPDKMVKDVDQNQGDTVVYDVTGTVRKLNADEKLKQFEITDLIDPKLEITGVEVKNSGEALVAEDYETPLYDGQDVHVKLTESGLAKLKTGDKVTVTITTKVVGAKEDPFTVVPNEAKVYQNKPGRDQDTEGTPTPKVKTYWGNLNFKKVDNKGNGLEGAEFQIARVQAPQKCDSINTMDKGSWEKLIVNGEQAGKVTNTFKSNDQGVVDVRGLHVTDFADNKEVTERERPVYCLIETKAPKGKELLAEAIQFELVATNVTENNRTYQTASVTVGKHGDGTVENLDDTTPKLPMTGGAGVGILAAIGAAIVAAGAWFARRSAKN
ncbi:surface-anchored protein fimbrial subunit [Corynebacterium diphtheriae HC01]|uniref:SpaH/EbpB family LPXTG-anchored major pilin n=1 Tax=Corynebacterium diphtheriae TaxID=1717 RepID=UPI000245ADE2|nr:SpaH/EbpB family LPXTG-anchored major pilin [Corynebacterium diphtheriae]AEX43256.1 putative surface-anchored fimbrial subunit [Corynebacterium diphtheriae 241]AEX73444.1 surface-anchored protein fimbrial subunit [Corynebacterium diphtheriae HC01]OSP97686.1 pilus assembly protein [Corynebacterium diphtheriae]CAB0676598.1 type-2 fimbrial major subunit [Corynebacterium diphtheriae]CAB0676726.1 type-2 fimbrial major subunit [Corynebacterium diphtheriae]